MTKGQRIKSQREMMQMSQTELAKKAGISKQTLYKYENDIVTNIPSDTIETLSQILGCSPAFIMGWDDAGHLIEYAKRLSELPQDKLDNALQYIDFLNQGGKK